MDMKETWKLQMAAQRIITMVKFIINIVTTVVIVFTTSIYSFQYIETVIWSRKDVREFEQF